MGDHDPTWGEFLLMLGFLAIVLGIVVAFGVSVALYGGS